MTTRRTAWTQVYVVVRVELTSGAQACDVECGPAIEFGGYNITVKEVVLSADQATREVKRLNPDFSRVMTASHAS